MTGAAIQCKHARYHKYTCTRATLFITSPSPIIGMPTFFQGTMACTCNTRQIGSHSSRNCGIHKGNSTSTGYTSFKTAITSHYTGSVYARRVGVSHLFRCFKAANTAVMWETYMCHLLDPVGSTDSITVSILLQFHTSRMYTGKASPKAYSDAPQRRDGRVS